MSKRGRIILLLLLHVIFLLSGIATVFIGQVLPILTRQFALNDLQAGFFFPAQFAGSLCGTFATGRFAKRDNYTAATIIGGVAMASGGLMMNVDSFAVCLAGFYIMGCGVGLTLPSINMMVVELSHERSAAALSFLNFCWGVGAIISKPFVDLFGSDRGLGMATYVLAFPLLICSGALLLFTSPSRKHSSPFAAEPADERTAIWSTPLAWTIALFNFLHVGFESGMGGWLTTYSERVDGRPLLSWLSPTLLYFTFFVIGRGVAPVLFRFLDENRMLFFGLAVLLAGMGITLWSHSVAGLSLGGIVTGFGTSWIFPTNVSRFSKTFGVSATRRATPLFMMGTLGAAAVTWLIGFLSNRSGDLRYGMFVLGGTVVLLMLIQAVLAIRTRRLKIIDPDQAF